MSNEFDQSVIEEFRANNGRVGGPFERARLLLLTTRGARSGREHTTPLGYLQDEQPARVLVIASAGGMPRNPDWYHNILADPRVHVDNGVFNYQARATVLRGAERDQVFARAVEADSGWADYQERSGRVIPVVALEPDGAGAPNADGWGAGLRLIHDAFRRELRLIRQEVVESGPGIGAQLRINCLSLCGGLHHHHTMEDTGMFPTVSERNHELAPVLDRLAREHREIQRLLDELERLLTEPGSRPGDLLPELDRLTRDLLDHLAFEEEQLIPVLDAATA